MKYLVLLGLSFLAYTFLSYILLLRNDWALDAIAQFYPSVGQTLVQFREQALPFHLNTIPTVLLFAILLSAFFCYVKILRGQWVTIQRPRNILLWSLAFQGIVLFSYPVLSSDVFDYILNTRIPFVYGKNPWTVPAIDFPGDPFINLASWPRITSVYGPVHHLLTIIPAILGLNNLAASLLGFKLLMIAFTVLGCYTVMRLLGERNKTRALALFALNPLLLIETAGNAHNDIIMVTFMLVSLLALRKQRFLLSGMFIALGTLVKLYAVVLLPFYIFLILKKTTNLGKTASLLLGFMVVMVAGGWFMGKESIINQLQLFGWVATLKLNSLPNLLNMIPDWIFTLPFVLFALFTVRTIGSEKELVAAYVKLTLVYLMFVVTLYWAWYPIWYLPFLSLLPITKLTKAALTFSATSSLQYAILFTSHRFDYTNPLWTLAIYAFLVVPPIGVYLFTNDGKRT